ncbi:hypothetical protein CPC08DRAFT_47970 [Agrocybe pediades]|nr:hypothetical protein CPC08DRAFT_47970 [Agrocybe pediades]
MPLKTFFALDRQSNSPQLPVEIWSYIFSYSAVDSPILTHAISQTCTLWRNIALSTPRLWTQMVVLGYGTSYRDVFPNHTLINLWITRSRSKLLDIVFYGRGSDDGQRVLDKLLGELARWRTAVIHASDLNNARIAKLHRGTANGAPLLESLKLYTDFLQHTEVPSILWSKSPRLRNLRLQYRFVEDRGHGGALIPGWLTTCHIPFHQLTVFTVNCDLAMPMYELQIGAMDVVSLLRAYPNLVVCRLDAIHHHEPRLHVLSTQPTVLPNLKVLELSLSSQVPFSGRSIPLLSILRQFVAPSLQTLILGGERNWDSASFRQFIEDSGCSLQSIVLEQSTLTDQQFEDCLLVNPSLKKVLRNPQTAPALQHVNPVLSRDTISRLAKWDPESKRFALCPELEDLSFPFSCLSQDDDAPFARMIEARLTLGSQGEDSKARPAFKTLQLFDYDCSSSLPLPVAELKLLWTLRERYGLDIVFVDLRDDKIRFEDVLDWDALLDRDGFRSPG